jgi:iron complex outermembrane receptor protein
MYLRLSKRSSSRSICSHLHAVTAASIIAIASATGALAQSAEPAMSATEGQLPPLEVETTAKKKVVKKKPDVTNTRLTNTGGAPAQTGAGSTAEPTGGLGEQVPDGGGITGASTTVITREQIERAPQASLPDIIGREAGVQTKSVYGGVNGVGTTVDLRGFGAASTSNTLILIDGRRQNDWDLAGFDLSKIPKDSIERIEITRGNSGAVLYGDGAVGGVINIVTRHGAALPNQGRIEVGIGSFQTREGDLTASGSSGPFSAFVNLNTIESDGYRANNELQQKSATGDFRWTFSKGSFYVSVGTNDQELRLPGSRSVNPTLGVNQLRDDRRGTSTPRDYANQEDERGTVGFTYMIEPGIELIVDGGVRAKEQQAAFFDYAFDLFHTYSDTDLTTRSFTPRVNFTQPLFGLPSRAIAGIDLYDTDYESRRSLLKGLDPVHVYDGQQKSIAGYFQETVSVLPTTEVSVGGRIQRNETTARDTYDLLAPQPFSELQGSPLDEAEINHAWHLGAEQKLVRGMTLFGRAAQSFRVPNIDERIAPRAFPTDFKLLTQKSDDWEAGMRFQFGSFQVQSSYYDMRLTDEIHYNPLMFGNINLDPTRRRGVETIASWQVMKDVRLSGNLTYTDAVFREGPNAGNQVPLVSRWTGNAGLSWNIIGDKLTFDTIARYVGDRRMDNDQPNFQPLIPSYTTVDIQFGGLVDQFFWSAGVANLTDVEYFDYATASASTFGVYNAYSLPGRTYMVKAGTTW